MVFKTAETKDGLILTGLKSRGKERRAHHLPSFLSEQLGRKNSTSFTPHARLSGCLSKSSLTTSQVYDLWPLLLISLFFLHPGGPSSACQTCPPSSQEPNHPARL